MSIGPWQLLILLAIIVLLFGTKRLRNIGSDVGSAVKGFKKSMKEEDDKPSDKPSERAIEDEEGTNSSDSKTESQQDRK